MEIAEVVIQYYGTRPLIIKSSLLSSIIIYRAMVSIAMLNNQKVYIYIEITMVSIWKYRVRTPMPLSWPAVQ